MSLIRGILRKNKKLKMAYERNKKVGLLKSWFITYILSLQYKITFSVQFKTRIGQTLEMTPFSTTVTSYFLIIGHHCPNPKTELESP